MRRFIALWLLAAICCLIIAGCSGESGTDSTDLKQKVTELLRQNPDIVLDVLRENNETVFHVAEQGMAVAQQRAIRDQRMAMVKNPLQPEIDPDRPIRGDKNAPITVVEYSDFQCPYCGEAARTVELMMQKHKGEVRLVFKHMPLSSHPQALPAARYFEAASLQDEEKAWQLHDIMFQNQEALTKGGAAWIKKQAADLGLDVEKLDKDAMSPEVNNRIRDDLREAKRFGISGTPHFVVGGVLMAGAQPLEEFTNVIELVEQNRAQEGDQNATSGNATENATDNATQGS